MAQKHLYIDTVDQQTKAGPDLIAYIEEKFKQAMLHPAHLAYDNMNVPDPMALMILNSAPQSVLSSLIPAGAHWLMGDDQKAKDAFANWTAMYKAAALRK
jgi:hypothetical protein